MLPSDVFLMLCNSLSPWHLKAGCSMGTIHLKHVQCTFNADDFSQRILGNDAAMRGGTTVPRILLAWLSSQTQAWRWEDFIFFKKGMNWATMVERLYKLCSDTDEDTRVSFLSVKELIHEAGTCKSSDQGTELDCIQDTGPKSRSYCCPWSVYCSMSHIPQAETWWWE